MSYPAAKEVCSPAEIQRFACAFLNCKDVNHDIDWEAAAEQYDAAVKTQSFRTVTLRAMKKAIAAAGKGTAGARECGDREGKKANDKGEKKRKADGECNKEGQGGKGRSKVAKAKSGKRAKKNEEEKVDENAAAEGKGEREALDGGEDGAKFKNEDEDAEESL